MPQQLNPPVVCTDPATVSPVVTCVEGSPNFPKMQAVQVAAGQIATIDYTMVNPDGDPVDLSACLTSGGHVELRIREAVLGMNEIFNTGVTIQCTLPVSPGDGSDGHVLALLTAEVVAVPGISKAEFGLLDSNDVLIFSNEIFLIVNRSQFTTSRPGLRMSGPPTIPEIRLHLRDSAPEDNLWLGVQEFDMAELAACIEKPIHYFNESPPPIKQLFNTTNFPSRHYYLEAIVACLYNMASLHYTRVHLPYQQAHGLTVDDKNKAEQYAAIGKAKWEEWKNWVRHKKIQFNAAASIRSFGSPYYYNMWAN